MAQSSPDDPTASYTFSWSGVPAGAYQLRAAATDNLGATTLSAPISITVTGIGPAVLVTSNSIWRYLDTGTNLGTVWIDPGFDDTGWSNGAAELGYGDVPDGRPEATVINQGNPRYITTISGSRLAWLIRVRLRTSRCACSATTVGLFISMAPKFSAATCLKGRWTI
jgi:hypothetical protein